MADGDGKVGEGCGLEVGVGDFPFSLFFFLSLGWMMGTIDEMGSVGLGCDGFGMQWMDAMDGWMGYGIVRYLADSEVLLRRLLLRTCNESFLMAAIGLTRECGEVEIGGDGAAGSSGDERHRDPIQPRGR